MEDDKPLKLRDETDFFVCDVFDAVPKDDIASMEHPIFSLSAKPDKEVRCYQLNGYNIKITPSGIGLATIHDKDILIYCMSQIVAKMNKGEKLSKTVRIKARDLLISTNRGTGGRDYKLLKDSFERLRGTSITTDIETNNKRIVEGFGLIDKWKIITEDLKTDKMVELEITLSDWMYNSILGKEFLTISKNYFELRSALDRRIYELARKYCGKQNEWRIDINNLKEKCGSQSNIRHFKYLIGKVCESQQIPDYEIFLDQNIVLFKNKKEQHQSLISKKQNIQLKSSTYEKARSAAPGYDVYALEQEWLQWWKDSGEPELRSSDAAFIGFCRQKYQNSVKPYGLLL
ncbi:replication initiator protein A [Scytonema tolypothrichoides VB-61278]|nr:replication initiator protein A [Scytonema tolypothrichoides VB-61278]